MHTEKTHEKYVFKTGFFSSNFLVQVGEGWCCSCLDFLIQDLIKCDQWLWVTSKRSSLWPVGAPQQPVLLKEYQRIDISR